MSLKERERSKTKGAKKCKKIDKLFSQKSTPSNAHVEQDKEKNVAKELIEDKTNNSISCEEYQASNNEIDIDKLTHNNIEKEIEKIFLWKMNNHLETN